jgi:photosystem II stability/assembly factor-like uncharacterized protein
MMSSNVLFIASSQGVIILEREGEAWREVGRGLASQQITSISLSGSEVLAGTRDGIYRSQDAGQTWRASNDGLSALLIRWLAHDPGARGVALAGTEPAAILISEDGGATWRECPEVAVLRERHGWYLPYSSGAGCVRGFAFHGDRVYAAVEVGGLLRSDDGGRTWGLVEGSSGDPRAMAEGGIHPDVHSVAVHPSSPDLVFAPTGGGFFRSLDGGRSWSCLYDCYCRDVWLDPARPDNLLLGPADGVNRDGRIEGTQDGGQTWTPAWDGLQAPWSRHMVERFLQVGDELVAVLSNGELVASPLATLAWRRIGDGVAGARAVAVRRR